MRGRLRVEKRVERLPRFGKRIDRRGRRGWQCREEEGGGGERDEERDEGTRWEKGVGYSARA